MSAISADSGEQLPSAERAPKETRGYRASPAARDQASVSDRLVQGIKELDSHLFVKAMALVLPALACPEFSTPSAEIP